MSGEHIHFVTGRLAADVLRETVADVASEVGFAYSIEVLPISVAALMTPVWIARHVHPPAEATRILVPGYCGGDLGPIRSRTGREVAAGPRDVRQLPEYFGRAAGSAPELDRFDIEILAEINHAPRLARQEILQQARQLTQDGADVIDLGCEPGAPWSGVADCVHALCQEGYRVSIDSWEPVEVQAAVGAGAELVLSVQSAHCAAAVDWGAEVVAVPDDFSTLAGLDQTVQRLSAAGVPFRIDPVLEPIGCGFAASLGRYLEVRRRYPEAPMLMGIGNLTELSDADSAGINLLLLGICQELGIHSVLTTQVINWARTSVRECDLARRMVRDAVRRRVPAKHLDPRLVLLRDPRLDPYGPVALERLAAQIRDQNYRIFAEDGRLHLINADRHLTSTDAFDLCSQLLETQPANLDARHAFYLGYELAKAVTALTLGKQYRQDEPLDWGYLTRPEPSHAPRRRSRKRS